MKKLISVMETLSEVKLFIDATKISSRWHSVSTQDGESFSLLEKGTPNIDARKASINHLTEEKTHKYEVSFDNITQQVTMAQ